MTYTYTLYNLLQHANQSKNSLQDCSVQASLTEYITNYITNDDGQITLWGVCDGGGACRTEYKAHALVNNTG